jgi:hypothetical protein
MISNFAWKFGVFNLLFGSLLICENQDNNVQAAQKPNLLRTFE